MLGEPPLTPSDHEAGQQHEQRHRRFRVTDKSLHEVGKIAREVGRHHFDDGNSAQEIDHLESV